MSSTNEKIIERRMINKLSMNQSVKLKLGLGETKCVKNGRGVGADCFLV
jgi:hypothetical protein